MQAYLIRAMHSSKGHAGHQSNAAPPYPHEQCSSTLCPHEQCSSTLYSDKQYSPNGWGGGGGWSSRFSHSGVRHTDPENEVEWVWWRSHWDSGIGQWTQKLAGIRIGIRVWSDRVTKKRKFTPKEETVVFLKGLTDKPLKNEERKSVATNFTLPSCDPAHPPKLVISLIPKSAKTNDRFLSKFQQFSMDTMGPLLFLHEHLASESPDIDKSRSAVKSGLVLLA